MAEITLRFGDLEVDLPIQSIRWQQLLKSLLRQETETLLDILEDVSFDRIDELTISRSRVKTLLSLISQLECSENIRVVVIDE